MTTLIPMSATRKLATRREKAVLFVVFSAMYLAVAAVMSSRNIIFPDALSRVSNSFYVLYSRYPHLPAIGFVWNPLPSLLLLPLLPLKAVFPALVTHGFAGNISSSLFMAGAVSLMASCLAGLSVGKLPRLVLSCLFGLMPMIVFYAGSGLSEPALIFFLLLTTSSMIAWSHQRAPRHLVTAGLALGLGYMTRYEAIGPAFAVTMLVGLVTLFTYPGARRMRAQMAVNDMALVVAPFLLAFALWSVSAKILVNSWFPTFSSQYGNSAQVQASAANIHSATGSTLPAMTMYMGRQILALAVMIVLLLGLTLVVRLRVRRLSALMAPIVLGGVLAFDDLAFLDGKSFGWLRFQIAVIPLAVLLAGDLIAALGEIPRRSRRSTRLRLVSASAVVAMVAVAAPVQFRTLAVNGPDLAREEFPMLHAALFTPSGAATPRILTQFEVERTIGAYVDSLALPSGSVLTDDSSAFAVVVSSRRPKSFIINSDFDFQDAVRDPSGHHVRYFLVPSPADNGPNVITEQWPTLFAHGAGIAVLARQWSSATAGTWRLYKVVNG